MSVEVLEVMGRLELMPVNHVGTLLSRPTLDIFRLVKSGDLNAYIQVQLKNYENTSGLIQLDLIKLQPAHLFFSDLRPQIFVESLFEDFGLPKNEYNLWKKHGLVNEIEKNVWVDVTLFKIEPDIPFSFFVSEELVSFRFQDGPILSMPMRKGALYIKWLLEHPNKQVKLEDLVKSFDQPFAVEDPPLVKPPRFSVLSESKLGGSGTFEERCHYSSELRKVRARIQDEDYDNEQERANLEKQEEDLEKHIKTLDRAPRDRISKKQRDRVRKAIFEFINALAKKDIKFYEHLKACIFIKNSVVTYGPNIKCDWVTELKMD